MCYEEGLVNDAEPRFDPKIPKTFCYVNWDFPRGIRITSLAWDITFRTAIADHPGLYFQLYDGNVNGVGKYFGFQTRIDQGLGRGLIYSRWSTRDLNLIRPGTGSVKYDSDHEGDFISVRQSSPWRQGAYRVTFQLVESRAGVDWYGLSCLNRETGIQKEIGSLGFPQGEGISNGCGTWLELYTTTFHPDDLPRLEIAIDSIIANGSVRPEFARITYKPEEIPSKNANVVLEKEAVIIQAGRGVVQTTRPGQHRR